jgi:hypothetical protein
MQPSIKLIFGLLMLGLATACSAQPKTIPTPPLGSGSLTSTPVPTSDPSKATIQGTIIVDMNGKTIPIKDTNLFLSPILKDKNGIERVAQFDRSQCPFTQSDDQGSFVFTNVPEGRYALILDKVVQSFLMTETTSDYSLTITAKAGQVTDLKTLHYHSLPVTPDP